MKFSPKYEQDGINVKKINPVKSSNRKEYGILAKKF